MRNVCLSMICLLMLVFICWARVERKERTTFSLPLKEMEAISLRAIDGVRFSNEIEPSVDRSIIPLILHQSWRTADIHTHSADAVKCKVLIKKYAAEFTQVLWTDADLHLLIKTYYPQYLNYYENLNMNIKRADFSRYLIIHKFGGLYMDLDIELKRPLIELFDIPTNMTSTTMENSPLQFISYISKSFELKQHGYNTLFAGNAFFGAVAGHPIIANMINHTMTYTNQMCKDKEILTHSGPIGLGHVVRRYTDQLQQVRNQTNKVASFEAGIVLLNSTVVGDVADKPSHAVHLRKHKWSRN